MQLDPMPVEWREVVVGHIANPKSDHMFLYGDWCPTQVPSVRAFLETIEREGEATVRVGAKKPLLRGFVAVAPDETIEVRLTPDP